MAKQVGPFKLTGCYDNICFYKMDGQYFARTKSSLDGKRVKKDPAFAATMRYAGLLGKASKIASSIYRSLPKEKKEPGLYRKLTGQAMLLLKDDKTTAEVLELLQPKETEQKSIPVSSGKSIVEKVGFADAILSYVFGGTVNLYKENFCCIEAPS